MNREQFLTLTKKEQEAHIDGLLYIKGTRLELNWSNTYSNIDFNLGLAQIYHLIDSNISAAFVCYNGWGILHILELSGTTIKYECMAGSIGFVGILRKVILHQSRQEGFVTGNYEEI